MRKSLITTAVLGALLAPSFVFAADAAPAPDWTLTSNVGVFSQYIFRGLTQTDRKAALQGGIDLTHSSGFYAGVWASNISWLRDNSPSYYTSGGSVETDLYAGFRKEIASTGITADLGVLQYYYPGQRNKASYSSFANTTELYGALSYGWLQGKISGVVSRDAWEVGKQLPANEDARGTFYAELNATIPVGDLIGKDAGVLSGVALIGHVGRQEFQGDKVSSSANYCYGPGSRCYSNNDFSYTDYKLGVQKSFSEGLFNGTTFGAFATYADEDEKRVWGTAAGNKRDLGAATGTAFIQRTF
jgi:uncharacterized protein (TIGR02001 family)